MVLTKYYISSIIGFIVYTLYIRDVGLSNLMFYTMFFACRGAWRTVYEVLVEGLNKYLPASADIRDAHQVINTILFCVLFLFLCFLGALVFFSSSLFDVFKVERISWNYRLLQLIIVVVILAFDALEAVIMVILRALGREWHSQTIAISCRVIGLACFLVYFFIPGQHPRIASIFVYEAITLCSAFLALTFFLFKEYNIVLSLRCFSFSRAMSIFIRFYSLVSLMSAVRYLRETMPLFVLSSFGYSSLAAIFMSSINLNIQLRWIPASFAMHLKPLTARLFSLDNKAAVTRRILKPYMNMMILANSLLAIVAGYLVVFLASIWYPEHAVLSRSIFLCSLFAYTFLIFFGFAGSILYVTPYFKRFAVASCVAYVIAFAASVVFIHKLTVYGFLIFNLLASLLSCFLAFKYFLSVTKTRHTDYRLEAVFLAPLMIASQIILYAVTSFPRALVIHSVMMVPAVIFLVRRILQERGRFVGAYQAKESEYSSTLTLLLAKG